jgi:CDP-diacylglycerol--glycerol-3-phosphate 3-phosphatidyltransferase
MIARTGRPERPHTIPNVVTGVRLVASLVCFAIAAARSDPRWSLAGLALHWALDAVDGFLARTLRQETRTGAQMDIIADRLTITFFYYTYLTWHPELAWPVGLFLLQFVGLDLFLSMQFLRWPILSPNYFYLVDRQIWALNWSGIAKFCNTGLVTILNLVPGTAPVTIVVCLCLIGLKTYSWVRLHGLPWPEERWA